MPLFYLCVIHKKVKFMTTWEPTTDEFIERLNAARMTVQYVPCDECEQERAEQYE